MKDKSMKQENQKRTHIFSGSTFEELAGYSRAVVVGDHIYVSGTVGINFQTGKLPEDAAGQAEQALDTIEKALHQAQSGLHDVVRVRVSPLWPFRNAWWKSRLKPGLARELRNKETTSILRVGCRPSFL